MDAEEPKPDNKNLPYQEDPTEQLPSMYIRAVANLCTTLHQDDIKNLAHTYATYKLPIDKVFASTDAGMREQIKSEIAGVALGVNDRFSDATAPYIARMPREGVESMAGIMAQGPEIAACTLEVSSLGFAAAPDIAREDLRNLSVKERVDQALDKIAVPSSVNLSEEQEYLSARLRGKFPIDIDNKHSR